MDLLRVEHIRKTYGSGETAVHALKDVSFTVPKGEFVTIVGESGSGKSTLLNMIGALDTPTSGRIFISDKNTFSMSERELTIFRRRNIGFIFQSFNLIPELTVEQNMIFPLLLDRQRPNKKYLEELLDVLGLEKRRGHLPGQLSGGQQQRVALAAVLVMNQDVFVIDEPTSQLDPQSTDDVFEIIRLMKDMGKTIVLVEHKMEQIAEYADKVVVMDRGEIVMEGTPEKVFSDPRCEEHHIRLPQCTGIALELRKEGIEFANLPVTVTGTVDAIRMITGSGKA